MIDILQEHGCNPFIVAPTQSSYSFFLFKNSVGFLEEGQLINYPDKGYSSMKQSEIAERFDAFGLYRFQS